MELNFTTNFENSLKIQNRINSGRRAGIQVILDVCIAVVDILEVPVDVKNTWNYLEVRTKIKKRNGPNKKPFFTFKEGPLSGL